MRSTLPRQTTRLLPLTSEGPAKKSILKAKELCKEIVDISLEKPTLHLHLVKLSSFPIIAHACRRAPACQFISRAFEYAGSGVLLWKVSVPSWGRGAHAL